jgi:hypothetical protein
MGRAGRRGLIVFVTCAVTFLEPRLMDLRPDATATDVPGLLRQLHDADWQRRSEAFYRLLELGGAPQDPDGAAGGGRALSALLQRYPQSAEDIRLALIKTLEKENRVVQESPSLPSEDYTEDYYADLIAAVVSLGDVRSVEAVVGAMGTGNLVINALVAQGDVALDAVIERLKGVNEGVIAQSAVIVLGRMLDPANPNGIRHPEGRRKIKEAIQGALNRAGQELGAQFRVSAIEALSTLGDADVIRLAAGLAKTDAYEASQHGGGAGVFPVRQAATNALVRLGQEGSDPTRRAALQALEEMKGEGSTLAREAAKDALRELGRASPQAGREALSDVLRRLGEEGPSGTR